MLTYTVSSNDLAEADIYEIRPVFSLAEFLEPHRSLCIVKTPYRGGIVEMTRVTGRTRGGEPARLYLGSASENDQGYFKSRLDKTLLSPFLFIAWKRRGFHTFKLVEARRTVAEFPDLDSALAAYLPEGFAPEKSYRRNRTVFELMCRAARRRALMRELVTLLDRWAERRRETAG